MLGLPLASQIVTVVRAGVAVDHGATVLDWAAATTHTVAGCSFQPTSGSEDRINRDAVTTVATVYAPAGADVTDTDRIRFGGLTYDIDGPVRRWAVGLLDHLEIPLKAVEG